MSPGIPVRSAKTPGTTRKTSDTPADSSAAASPGDTAGRQAGYTAEAERILAASRAICARSGDCTRQANSPCRSGQPKLAR